MNMSSGLNYLFRYSAKSVASCSEFWKVTVTVAVLPQAWGTYLTYPTDPGKIVCLWQLQLVNGSAECGHYLTAPLGVREKYFMIYKYALAL